VKLHGESRIDNGFSGYERLVPVSQMDRTVSLKLEPKPVSVSMNGSRSKTQLNDGVKKSRDSVVSHRQLKAQLYSATICLSV